MSSLASGTAIHHNKEVRLDVPPSQDSESTAVPEPSEKSHSKKPKFSWNPQKWKWPAILSWVPGQLNWQGLRPVIRSSVASWISFLLLFCTKTETVAGTAAFLYLVVGFIQPPVDPIVPVFVRLVYNILFVCFSWMVNVIASIIGHRMRGYPTQEDAIQQLLSSGYDCGTSTPQQCLQIAIYQGYFLEIGPTCINALFFSVAVTIILWIKMKYKQYVFSCVFAIICLVITMSYGPLYPYFDGTLGLLLVIPMGIQSAINFGCACFIFPQTVSHKYTRSLISVLELVKSGMHAQAALLAISPMNLDEWCKYKTIQESVQKGKSIFIGMIPMEEFLSKEICYSRMRGKELMDLKAKVRKLLSGLGGFHYWYFLIEAKITIHMQSRPNTPISTPRGSQVSLDVNDLLDSSDSSHSHSKSHIHLPHLAALHRHYEPVGVLESQSYSDLEATFQHSLDEKPTHYEDMVILTASTCTELLGECERGMSVLIKWFESVNSDRIYTLFLGRKRKIAERQELTAKLDEAIELLQSELDRFRNEKRFGVITPHLRWLQSERHKHRQPSYRLLFQSFFYQFHLVEFSTSLLTLLIELREHDVNQPLPKWWIPGFVELSKWIAKGGEDKNKAGGEDLAGDNQDPEEIPHVEIDHENETPIQVQKRNPDAGPPTNIGHLIGRVIVGAYKLVVRPDIFFAIKAGIVTVLIASMAWSKSTAAFWYENRGIWVVIMCALNISQYAADTVFGFVVRISGTFCGAILGMAIWYIGSGSGSGNAYALLAILGVVLPFIVFIRINFVYISPMPAIIFCITISLIVGYSWQDNHTVTASHLGYGWEVAYRRFLAVSAGITVGVIGSLIPFPVTGRSMIRATCSRTITELGQLHSDLQDYAYRRFQAAPGTHGKPDELIPLRQVAIQVKLNATKAQIGVQKFEPPLQGPWPGVLYSDMVALQVELIDLYGSFHSLLQQLEPAWIEALLSRNGWSDVHFVADHFAVIYMCANATKTGNALPQITPAPLVDRFYTKLEGLRITRVDRKGNTQEVNEETLHDWQYALYAIGCTLSFAICYRLDRLMMITKALVGEVYQVEHWKSRQRLWYPRVPPELQHVYSIKNS